MTQRPHYYAMSCVINHRVYILSPCYYAWRVFFSSANERSKDEGGRPCQTQESQDSNPISYLSNEEEIRNPYRIVRHVLFISRTVLHLAEITRV